MQDYDLYDPDDAASDRQGASDGVWDVIMNLPLSRASISGTWVDGDEPQASHFRIPLCLGGPSVWICGEFDERGYADIDTVHLTAAWWSPEVHVPIEQRYERDAVEWALGYWLS